MSCETARRMLEANDPALAGHMRSCPSCLIGAHARYYEAPPGLEQRIRRSLRQEQSAPPVWRWAAIAASVLLCVSIGWNVAQFRSHANRGQLLLDDVLSAHIRSLGGNHLLDVPSSDRHTVKPWFNGKLDFSPPVKEVEGFTMLGGRLEYFAGHPAAALVYSRGNHIINLFTWPAAAGPPGAQTRNGYHVEHWPGAGMAFWAVSDLNEAELRQFVTGYQRD